jgi:hypothetical protein
MECLSMDVRSLSTLLNLAKKVVDSVAIASSAPALVLMLAMAMMAMAVVPATDLATAPEKRPTLEGVFLRLDLASLSRIYGLRDDSKVLGAAILRSFFP